MHRFMSLLFLEVFTFVNQFSDCTAESLNLDISVLNQKSASNFCVFSLCLVYANHEKNMDCQMLCYPGCQILNILVFVFVVVSREKISVWKLS